MRFVTLLVLWFAVIMMIRCVAEAQPEFCSVEYFKSHELPTNQPNAKRLRCFQIGKLKLCGVAVGGSDPYELADMSPASQEEKYCTWYLNTSSNAQVAQQIFHHVHLTGPYWSWLPNVSRYDIANAYERKLNPQLPAMLTCVEKYNYKASGCNGQRHRGPSEMAWFLSIAGCSPETSERIVFNKFHLNGVKRSTRVEIAKRGYELGHKYPEYRKRFQKVMDQ